MSQTDAPDDEDGASATAVGVGVVVSTTTCGGGDEGARSTGGAVVTGTPATPESDAAVQLEDKASASTVANRPRLLPARPKLAR